MGLDAVLADLEAEGYTCQSFVIPACGIGAQHRRDRVWIVAHSEIVRPRSRGLPERKTPALSKVGCSFETFADSDRERQPQPQGAFGKERGRAIDSNQKSSPNTDSAGHEKQQLPAFAGDVGSGRVWQSIPDPQRAGRSGQAQPGICGSDDGLSTRLDTAIKDCFSVAAWVAKEETGPNYKNRIKALGNSIVPQVVYPILKAIAEIEKNEVLSNV